VGLREKDAWKTACGHTLEIVVLGTHTKGLTTELEREIGGTCGVIGGSSGEVGGERGRGVHGQECTDLSV